MGINLMIALATFCLVVTMLINLLLEDFATIGTGASFIMAGNQGHRHDWVTTFPFYYMNEEPVFSESMDAFQRADDTVIGNDVWIGSEVMMMPRVKVGHGAVIVSLALITKDVDPYTIVGGNPVIAIRKWFSAQEVTMLLEMEWWDWPLEQIKEAMPLLCSSDMAGL